MIAESKKLTGYDFWRETLGSPKFVAAPMVDMSELSFRMLCRHYNTPLCYTPMINSHQFLQDVAYRKSVFTTCMGDRPLIAQFCANDPETFVKAAKMVTSFCDAIDLNLGCPQGIARKGHYGAYLQENFPLIEKLIRHAIQELTLPITCKVRILGGPIEDTIQYAQMLERAGCSMIAVHGRTRDQKGEETGLASWEAIRAVKENISIPVIANGNILNFQDILLCLEFTKADGIMSAEGLLHNPALFTGTNPPVWNIIDEYLNLAEQHDTAIKIIRTHLFRFLKHSLEEMPHMRFSLANASTISHFRQISSDIQAIFKSNLPNSLEIYRQYHQRTRKESHRQDIKESGGITDIKDTGWIDTGLFSIEEIITDEKPAKLEENVWENEAITCYHLPIWQCHSRPRVTFKGFVKGFLGSVLSEK